MFCSLHITDHTMADDEVAWRINSGSLKSLYQKIVAKVGTTENGDDYSNDSVMTENLGENRETSHPRERSNLVFAMSSAPYDFTRHHIIGPDLYFVPKNYEILYISHYMKSAVWQDVQHTHKPTLGARMMSPRRLWGTAYWNGFLSLVKCYLVLFIDLQCCKLF